MYKFLIFLCSLSTFIQNSYGQIPIFEELTTKQCPIDSTANAMIILAKGETSFDDYGNTIIKYYYRIKIFKKEALNDWANINLDARKGEISDITGTTYNFINGRIVEDKLEKKSIFKSKLTKAKVANRIAMPNVREGSVIEYSFVRKVNRHIMPDWIFQYPIPTMLSQYELKRANITSLEWIFMKHIVGDVRGPYKPTIYESKDEGKYQKWVMEKIPALKLEPMMPHPEIYFSKITFWSKGTYNWSDINAVLLRDIYFSGPLVNRTKNLQDKVAEITTGVTDTTEVIKKISEWIKDSITWDGHYYSFAAETVNVLEKKKGNAGDINLLFGAMLREKGFDVDMVLLSSHGNGFALEEIPSLSQFDYVVCLVTLSKTKQLFLDATEKYLPYNILPERCLNYKGFVVSKKRPGWIEMKPIAKKAVIISEELNFSGSFSAQGQTTTTANGYLGWQLRKAYLDSADFKNPYLNLNADKNQSEHKATFKNQNEIDKPFIIEQTLDEKTYGQTNGNKIYIDAFEDIIQDKNPFVTDTREYPIEFAIPIDETIIITITLPKNAVVEELPKSMGLTLPDNAARFLFQVSQANDKIIVNSKFQVNSSFILQNQYPKLRELYARMISKRDEMIVLTLKK